MLSEIQISASPIFVKSMILSMHKDAWVVWNQFTRRCRPYRHRPFLTTHHLYRSSVASYPMSLPQQLQTSRRERLGPLSKSFEACAYRVIYNYHPLLVSSCSHLVTGMSLEKLTPTDTSTILPVYLTAAQALPTIESNISQSFPPNPLHAPTSGPGHISNPSFVRYRELWRWVERLLRRAIIVASRTCSLNGAQESVLWSLFSQYRTCSAHWPPTFRATHRSTISVLFIRALVFRARVSGDMPLSLYAHFHRGSSDVPTTASTIARRVIQDYRDILNASTRFPKAGERNVRVEELTDLCVAVWEAGGSKSGDAAWVMDVRVPRD